MDKYLKLPPGQLNQLSQASTSLDSGAAAARLRFGFRMATGKLVEAQNENLYSWCDCQSNRDEGDDEEAEEAEDEDRDDDYSYHYDQGGSSVSSIMSECQ
eukprot:s1645_g12.t1